MKILKLKMAGLAIYPATITNAIKDSNFLKEDGGKEVPMTLSEINLFLNEQCSASKYTYDASTATLIINR